MKNLFNRLRGRWELVYRMTPHIGVAGALALRLSIDWNSLMKALRLPWRVRIVNVRPKGCRAPVTVRLDASDLRVFEQVFVEQQYLPATAIKAPQVVVDCGANVGYATLYFLRHFPNARVIAVEPDPDNAQMCRHNLQGYHDRITIIQKAIWGRPAKLEFVPETRGHGEEWGIQVRETMKSGPDTVDAIDVATIMAASGVDHIGLLKIDIEKSEAEVFQSPEQWLDEVDNIAIELHGSECSAIFRAAMGKYSYQEMDSGEITMCFNICRTSKCGVL